MKVGDIVQYGRSPHRVLDISNEQDGDYAHVKLECLEAFDDWLAVGEITETFAGRTSPLPDEDKP